MIENKDRMYELYERHAFGNKLRTWPSLEALLASGYAGEVSIRYRGAAGGSKYTAYNVPASDVARTVNAFCQEGALTSLFAFNESAPDEKLIFQGEVMRSPQHLSMRLSRERTKMRNAMANTSAIEHLDMLKAATELRSQLYPSSYSDLCGLFEKFPTSVVELSVYDTAVGDLPGRNAVIWEVRDY